VPQNKRKKDDAVEGNELPGWSGYRTRSNCSGLDPIDSRAEAGHIGGTLLRRLFTFQARTRNPIYILLMFIFGVMPFLTIVVFLIGGLPGLNMDSLGPMIYLVLVILITGTVTINFLLNILEILGVIPIQRVEKSVRLKAKRREKKLPKRRKDHK
jgi:hypothetical protein